MFPVFGTSGVNFGLRGIAAGNFHFVAVEAEYAQRFPGKLDAALHFLLDLLGRAEDVRIVLRETAHAQKTVQHAGTLVAIDGAKLGETHRQFAIAAKVRLENQNVARAIHGLELVIRFFDFNRAEHVFAIEIRVAAGLPKVEQHDVRRVDQVVAAAEQFVAQPVFHQLADDAALRVPEDQAGTGFVLNTEKIEFLAELAMVAALGFLDFVEIFVEVLLLDEADAINPLHLRIFFLALPVGAGDVGELERLDAPGGGNVRAAAEIYEFSGGVKRHQRLGGLFLDQLAFELLVRFAVDLDRVELGDEFALVGNVLRGDLAHLRFDFREVFGRERLVAHEFVEKSVFDGRADAEFHIWVKLQDSGGEEMRGRVAENLERVGVLRGEDREIYAVVERARKVNQLAVNPGDERVLGEARPDLRGDLRGGGAAGHFAGRAVRQRDLNGFHFIVYFYGSDECRLEMAPSL